MLFRDPQDAYESLRAVGYETTLRTASTVWLADYLQKPILLEGPAGAGKTELAMSIVRAKGLHIERMQCYEGISAEQVLGTFDEALRDLYCRIYVKPDSTGFEDWQEHKRRLVSREFYRPGPVLRAFESEQRCLLLIDEIDKVGEEVESMLLEALSAWTISTGEFGTIEARTKPFVILTSNAIRDLGHALRRRCLFVQVQHPTAEQEAHIVGLKSPSLSSETRLFIAALAKVLRSQKWEKAPSVSEMQDLGKYMSATNKNTLTNEDIDCVLPIFCKTPGDVTSMTGRRDYFASLLKSANRELALTPRQRQ